MKIMKIINKTIITKIMMQVTLSMIKEIIVFLEFNLFANEASFFFCFLIIILYKYSFKKIIMMRMKGEY